MNACQRCGRPGPGGTCPDCTSLIGPAWSMENDDTLTDGFAPIVAYPARSQPVAVIPPPVTAAMMPPPPIYRTPPSSWVEPTVAAPAPSSPDHGYGQPQTEPRGAKRGRTVAVVALTVVGAAVLGVGGMFVVSMLMGSGDTTTVSGTMASSTPARTTATPSATPDPVPKATVTVTASETPTAAPSSVVPSSTVPAEGTSEGQSSVRATAAPPQRFERFYPLQRGDQGYVVEALQRILTWQGVRTYVDGDFGNATERSVRQWQAKEGLSVTGMVDDTTWESLLPELTKGSSGDAVSAMQQVLVERGYTVVVDGDFGAQTDRVVRQFQGDRGLPVDGLVGHVTWAALLA